MNGERTLELEIPQLEEDYTAFSQKFFSSELLPLLDEPTPSTIGQLITVEYKLKVAFYHDTVFSLGGPSGKVSIPFTILSQPEDLYIPQPVAVQKFDEPENWVP